MAEAPDTSDKRLEELEEEITCAVCQGHYQQAKLLPCNHYYCRACIEELAKRSRGRPFACPECRKEATLPPGGVEELQGAFFVERMKDLFGKMAKAEGKVEAVCELCSGGGKAEGSAAPLPKRAYEISNLPKDFKISAKISDFS